MGLAECSQLNAPSVTSLTSLLLQTCEHHAMLRAMSGAACEGAQAGLNDSEPQTGQTRTPYAVIMVITGPDQYENGLAFCTACTVLSLFPSLPLQLHRHLSPTVPSAISHVQQDIRMRVCTRCLHLTACVPLMVDFMCKFAAPGACVFTFSIQCSMRRASAAVCRDNEDAIDM